MPKISAPTVAEHRARQYERLVRAAREVFVAAGPKAVTPAAIAERVGLARSSVYEYFSSTDDLLAAVLKVGFEQWAEQVRQDVERVRDPRARVEAYVRRTLQLVAEGAHLPLVDLGRLIRDPGASPDLAAAHEALVAPLRSALAELEVAEPDLTAALLQGIVDAATRRIDPDDRPASDLVIKTAVALVGGAIRASR
jgi:AcrR family transcriptional regulator